MFRRAGACVVVSLFVVSLSCVAGAEITKDILMVVLLTAFSCWFVLQAVRDHEVRLAIAAAAQTLKDVAEQAKMEIAKTAELAAQRLNASAVGQSPRVREVAEETAAGLKVSAAKIPIRERV